MLRDPRASRPATDWVGFWNGSPSIYVSPRHRALHYAHIAADLAGLVPEPEARVLDYGCGEALAAADLAAACGHLTLCDAAPTVRNHLRARFASHPRIRVASPEEIAAGPREAFDMVVVNSVLQYLPRQALPDLLAMWRRSLAPHGRLLLGDIIPPDVGAMRDAAALLAFAARDGFFLAAVAGLARTAVSPYRKLRAELGLTFYGEGEMLALLSANGFSARRHRPNLGHNDARMTFLAEPSSA